MLNLLKACLFVSILVPLTTAQAEDGVRTAAIIGCLKAKAGETGSPLLINDRGKVRFRYHSGKYTFRYPTGEDVEVGRDDEVRIGVYSQSDQSVVIYDVFISSPQKTPVVEIASPSTFHRHSGKWIAGDNPNGIAMNIYLRSLLDTFAKQKSNVLSVKNVDDVAPANCIVLHP